MYLSNIATITHLILFEALRFKMLSAEMKVNIEVLFPSGLTRSEVYNKILRNLQSNSKDVFILKILTDPSVQEEETLILYLSIIATRNSEVGIELQCLANLTKELTSLWNLTQSFPYESYFECYKKFASSL